MRAIAAAVLLSTWISTAGATCLTPPGDVNASGNTNVSDVQCAIQTNLAVLGGGGAAPPACLGGPVDVVDGNCDGSVTVADVTLVISAALGIPLSAALDADADGCPDACDSSCVEGDDCDDGIACTHHDACVNGACAGVPYSCFDGQDCTDDICTGTGGCTFTLKPDYEVNTCYIAGSCVPDGQTQPGQPCRACIADIDTQQWSPVPEAKCNDGDPCTVVDHCENGSCVGSPKNCDDGRYCTLDSCQAGVCKNQPDASLLACLIDGQCVQAGVLPGGPVCRVCNPLVSLTAYVNNNGALCDDGDPCTLNDHCVNQACVGTPMVCADDLPCTESQCVGGTCQHTIPASLQGTVCVIDDACWFAGQSQPGADCLQCIPGTSTTDWSTNYAEHCYIGDTCYAYFAADPEEPCRRCRPEAPTAWTGANDFASCNDGQSSTTADFCLDAVCAGFEQTTTNSNSAYQERYRRAEVAPNGSAYATYTLPAGPGQTKVFVEHFDGGSAPYAVFPNFLGLVNDVPESVAGRFIVHGTTVLEFLNGGWTTNTKLFLALNAHLADGDALTTSFNGSDGVHFAGVNPTTGAFAYRCKYTTFNAKWTCTEVAVAFESKQIPVEIVSDGSDLYLVTNYVKPDGSPDDIDILKYTQLTPEVGIWLYQTNLAINAEAPYPLWVEEVESGAGYLVATGPGGTLVVSDLETDSVLVAPAANSALPAPASEMQYTGVTFDGERFIVTGSYDNVPHRWFQMWHAAASQNPMLPASWGRHTLGLSSACAGTGCDPFSEGPGFQAVTASSEGLHLFGAWHNSPSLSIDRSSWFRPFAP